MWSLWLVLDEKLIRREQLEVYLLGSLDHTDRSTIFKHCMFSQLQNLQGFLARNLNLQGFRPLAGTGSAASFHLICQFFRST